MGIIGIGIDILHVPRMRMVLGRNPQRFLARVLTKAELADFTILKQELEEQGKYKRLKEELDGQVDNKKLKEELDKQVNTDDRAVRFIGARWALKEACYKAMTPHHKLTWQDVSVYKDRGKPCLHIPEKEKFGIGNAHCSVSHDGEYLVAQVLFETPENKT
ncbi:hypothetical protein BGX29_012026 [Mortierella sp. GBA35]|nr:hypothetical protein BGX29_012026 [Mortierella sp. GBA35]KAG0220380.1 hypothetical protein BGX33_000055 [Mortierella sp. NVP41]